MPVSQIRPIAVTFTVPQDYLPADPDGDAAPAPHRCSRFTSDDKAELDHGTLADSRQRDRQHDRHDQAEGNVPQRGIAALARSVRQHPRPDRHQRQRR